MYGQCVAALPHPHAIKSVHVEIGGAIYSTPYVGMRGHRRGPERKIIIHLNFTLTKTFTLVFHFASNKKFILFYDSKNVMVVHHQEQN